MSSIVSGIANQIHGAGMLHIFSTHAWAYGHRREGLHEILEPWKRGVDYQDHSVPSDHPVHTKSDVYLAAYLGNLIRRSDVLLVMAGMYVNHSSWMDIEIHAAATSGVPIIPVLDNGQQRVPVVATRFACCDPVHWRSRSIRDAISSCINPDRRRAFEDGMHRREKLHKVEQQRQALFNTNSLAGPTLLSGRSALPSRPSHWPIPGGKRVKHQSLVEALMGPELPPIFKK